MARRVSSPLTVGRTDTQAALVAALAQASAGEPQLVLVAGEAGIGKTRMAGELAARAVTSGHRVLWGECVPLQAGELPYAPIVAALRGQEHGDELAALLAELRNGRGAAAHAPAQLFELLLGALGRLADTTPTLLVVEDVHWADRATQDLLRFLARNLRDERLLLVVTLRTDEPPAPAPLRTLLAELGRSPRVERLDLERLTPADTALQVEAIAGHDGATLAAWVHDRAEGNPYFTEELLAARIAGEPETALPRSLHEVLLARVADLDGPSRQVLHLAAAAGRDVSHELLPRAADLDAATLSAALAELVGEHVLIYEAANERFRFRHALAREAVYAALLPPERRALHAAIAQALEAALPEPDRGAADWAALAQHWDSAHEEALALHASVAAATSAHAVYAYQAERSQLERARKLWPRVAPAAHPSDLDEAELLHRLAVAARLAGDRDGAIPIAEAALALVDAAADPRRAARLHTLLGVLNRSRERSMAHLERALDLLPPEPSHERAAAMCQIAKTLVYGELPSDTRRFAEETLEVARAAGALAEEGLTHNMLGVAYAYGGDPERGLAHYGEALRIAREVGDPDRIAMAINNRADTLMMLGRLDEALEALRVGYEELRALGLAHSGGVMIQTTSTECELRLGRWDEVAARLRRLLETLHEDDVRLAHIALSIQLHARRGQFDEAAALDREAERLLTGNVSPDCIVLTATARAELALLRGDPQAARAIVDAARRVVRSGSIYGYPGLLVMALEAEADLAERARTAGREHELRCAWLAAGALLGSHCPGDTVLNYGFETPVGEPAPPETLALWAQGEAELARAGGEPAGDLWAETAARWERVRFPYPAAAARLREAEARLAGAGDRAAAAAALRSAHTVLAALGAAPLRERVEALARRARIPLVGVADGERPFDLTERELTVLERLAAGRTNRAIADELYLSTRTVDMHVRNILVKLDAANRVEAAATAHRLGLAGGTAVLP